MFGYSTELRSCTEVSSTLEPPVCFILPDMMASPSERRAVSAAGQTRVCLSWRLNTYRLILNSPPTVVSVGKRGVHHGVQQIPALPAGHTGGPHPQVFGGNRAAAR